MQKILQFNYKEKDQLKNKQKVLIDIVPKEII